MNTLTDLRRDPLSVGIPLGLAALLLALSGPSWSMWFFLAVAVFNIFQPAWIFGRSTLASPSHSLSSSNPHHLRERALFAGAILFVVGTGLAGKIFFGELYIGLFLGLVTVSFSLYLNDRLTGKANISTLGSAL